MSTLMSTQEYKNLLSQKSDKGKNKFNAKKTAADGFVFDSQAEAKRFFELKLLLRAFEIRDLVVHPKYALEVNGVKIGEYEADFSYTCPQRGHVIEDVKGGDAQRGAVAGQGTLEGGAFLPVACAVVVAPLAHALL